MWTFSAVFFTFASRRCGASVVNRLRLAFALVFLAAAHWITQGSLLPLNAAPARWIWLGVSGIIGLTLGDLALFQAYINIGPRLGTLIMSMVPVFSTILAWLFLGETLRPVQIAGILLTVAGIAIVVLERKEAGGPAQDRRSYLLGILFGFLAAVGQTTGLILTRRGVEGGFPALSAVLIRVLVACFVAWLAALVTRQTSKTLAVLKEPKTSGLVLAGSFVGPFLGVWFSTIAVQQTAVGIAATLSSLNPIMLLPFSGWLFGDKITPRAILGTSLTIGGVIILFLL